ERRGDGDRQLYPCSSSRPAKVWTMPVPSSGFDQGHAPRFKIKVAAFVERDQAYRRHFAPVEIADSRTLRSFLAFAHSLGRWPPVVGGLDADVDSRGLAGHECDGTGGSELFSWQATGDRSDRVPPLRLFFYLGTERGVGVAFIVHVVEER